MVREESTKILQTYAERGLPAGSHIAATDFGDEIVWASGFVRDEPVRLAIVELVELGYLVETITGFILTDRGCEWLENKR